MEQGRQTRQIVVVDHVHKDDAHQADIDMNNLPAASCGYQAVRDARNEKSRERKTFTIPQLKADGYRELEWDGRTTIAVTEKSSGKIALALVGQPNDPTYAKSQLNVTNAMLKASESANFTSEDLNHRRASNSPALNVGISYGMGSVRPGNLVNERQHTPILQALLDNKDLRRMASFADATFKLWSPRVYKYIDDHLLKLYQHNPRLKKNFDNSIFPCAAFNFGPQVCCYGHRDMLNCPFAWCAIQALGQFDHTKGGHLVVEELKLYIQFPAGALIHIPSATLTHGNTPVQEHEIRLSFTQFCAGGLLRFVNNGFQGEKGLKRRNKRLYQQKMEEKKDRWEMGLALLCTVDEILDPAIHRPRDA
ncbi:hypothetical protein FA15DRAFT_603109 [Coprinopsis marcescibilis]|uniref:2OGFeDO JBP1/TET oxygenase domain-containing protein n=1 Tax=Coprinopsis marcescibilis TaxID=230819 RepID=A0A5C3KFM5_COPMA|nr:hypothetical protein FA15DRAFT_603109 [Coprinopsis marcescibilis]